MVMRTTYIFGISLPITALYGLWLVFSNWKESFIQKRQPYAQVLLIIACFLIGFLMEIFNYVTYTLHIESTYTWDMLVTVNILMLGLYILYFYRAWMLWYKNRLQCSYLGMVVDDIPESEVDITGEGQDRSTKSAIADDFWVRKRPIIGNSKWVSLMGICAFAILTGINIAIVWNLDLNSLKGLDFQPYDYYDMTVSALFISSGLLISGCAMIKVEDSFMFTTEIRMVSVSLILGLSLFWIFYRRERMTADHKLKVSFNILQSTALVILITVDYNLYMASKLFSPKEEPSETPASKTLSMDDVLHNETIFRQFEQHLKKEFSIENLNFLKTVIYLRQIRHRPRQSVDRSNSGARTPRLQAKDSLTLPDRITATSVESVEELRMHWMRSTSKKHKRVTSVARFIYEEFCVVDAPQEINLGRLVMKKLQKHFSKSMTFPPPINIFDEAYKSIVDLLTNDSLRRFNFQAVDCYNQL